MKKILLSAGIIILAIAGAVNLRSKNKKVSFPTPTENQDVTKSVRSKEENTPRISIIAENLDTPWGMAFLPDKSMLVTERPGRVRFIDRTGKLQVKPVAVLVQAKEIGEGGLLGIALHPEFSSNGYVYLYYTYEGDEKQSLNRVVRMIYKDAKLGEEEVLVDAIPGAPNHNGGRIKFGPDKFLYITTGDAQDPSRSQDKKSLAGKILRVTDEGKPAPVNPFGNLIYSYGHRNPQGLAWNSKGELWSSEHGRSGIQSGLDELNIIQAGYNYGWPTIQGTEGRVGMETPRLNSGDDTWAPAGAAFIADSLFFGGLRGQALYEAIITGSKISLKEHFKGELGRVRDVAVGPDQMLYITTSNQDGRGIPDQKDDKIIRVNPKAL